MTKKLMGRSEMIQHLVAYSVKTAISESPTHWLNGIFENGFIGYKKLTTSQLLMEMEMRGLIQSEEHFDDDAQDADDLCMSHLSFN